MKISVYRDINGTCVEWFSQYSYLDTNRGKDATSVLKGHSFLIFLMSCSRLSWKRQFGRLTSLLHRPDPRVRILHLLRSLSGLYKTVLNVVRHLILISRHYPSSRARASRIA